MIKIYLLLFYGGVLMLSCNPGTQSSPDAPYYDVKGYISNQIDLLKKRDVPVSKWALFNGKEENVEIEHLNWERELKSFMEKNDQSGKPRICDFRSDCNLSDR
ncbi:MAG: hypothetical protein IIA45_06870 [Bacteroidetes bacterium]|nr:hypothetical protein [Bacteroidota bacterium]